MSIYSEVNDIQEAISLILQDDNKSEEEKQDAIHCLIDLQQTTLENGLDNLQKVQTNIKNDIEGVEKEIRRLQAKKDILCNKLNNIKDYIMFLLKQSNKDKLKTALYSFSIRKTKAVNVVDISKISEEFFIIKKQLDRVKLKEYLQNNTCDGANIIENESLIVK